MNPLDGTFANNALKHGVAGLNIDECRVGTDIVGWNGLGDTPRNTYMEGWNPDGIQRRVRGRFPANLIHDGSQMVLELFPESRDGVASAESGRMGYHGGRPSSTSRVGYGGNGSAARFFYCAKASKTERDRGLEGLPESQADLEYRPNDNGSSGLQSRLHGATIKGHNNHPTVKPLALMEYLVKLVKMPEYNLIIDPFCGSGTTLLACIRLGIPCIGIDSDEKACEIAAKRCSQ